MVEDNSSNNRRIFFHVKGLNKGILITDNEEDSDINILSEKISNALSSKSVFTFSTKNDIVIARSDEISLVNIQRGSEDIINLDEDDEASSYIRKSIKAELEVTSLEDDSLISLSDEDEQIKISSDDDFELELDI